MTDYGVHKDQLQDLLLFWSAKEKKLISLKEYAEAMADEQKFIYFAVGDSRSRLQQLPQTEMLLSKGYDVLLFTEDVDEFIAQTLMQYNEKEFRSVSAEDLQADEEKPDETASQPVLDFVKEALDEKVAKVRLSRNLGSHPVFLSPDGGMSFEMAKYFNKLHPEAAIDVPKVLELNAEHKIFVQLQNLMGSNPEKAKKYAQILYSQALLMAGMELEDPTA